MSDLILNILFTILILTFSMFIFIEIYDRLTINKNRKKETNKTPSVTKKIEDVLVPIDFIITSVVNKHFDQSLVPLITVSDKQLIRDTQINEVTETAAVEVLSTISEAAMNDLYLFINPTKINDFIVERVYLQVLDRSIKFNSTKFKKIK